MIVHSILPKFPSLRSLHSFFIFSSHIPFQTKVEPIDGFREPPISGASVGGIDGLSRVHWTRLAFFDRILH